MAFVRRHPLLSTAILVALAAFGILAVTAVAVWRAAHTDDASRIERTDAILVLGAAQYSGEPSPVFRGRLEQAVLLYRGERAPRVLVMGANRQGDLTTEAAAGRQYLIEQGLPADAVYALAEGNTTYESLRAAAEYMREHGMSSAFLVSDPWHNLRIKRMAGDLGIEAYASATWHSAARSQGARLAGYARETFAYLYYRLFHR